MPTARRSIHSLRQCKMETNIEGCNSKYEYIFRSSKIRTSFNIPTSDLIHNICCNHWCSAAICYNIPLCTLYSSVISVTEHQYSIMLLMHCLQFTKCGDSIAACHILQGLLQILTCQPWPLLWWTLKQQCGAHWLPSSWMPASNTLQPSHLAQHEFMQEYVHHTRHCWSKAALIAALADLLKHVIVSTGIIWHRRLAMSSVRC